MDLPTPTGNTGGGGQERCDLLDTQAGNATRGGADALPQTEKPGGNVTSPAPPSEIAGTTMQQKALIVTTGSKKPKGLDELNIALERGWRVAVVSPMGGSGASKEEPRFAALVVIERHEDVPSSVLHAVEEAEEENLDGDGTSREVADNFNDGPPAP